MKGENCTCRYLKTHTHTSSVYKEKYKPEAVLDLRVRAVLTNGHTGHVPRDPGFFFFLRGPQTVADFLP